MLQSTASIILVFLTFLSAYSQKNVISGRIVDNEDGTPVKYAQIHFSGTFCGTATNSNGEFILNTTSCNGTNLIITATPYEKKKVLVRDLTQPVEIGLQKRPLRSTFRLDQTEVCRVIESAIQKIPSNYYSDNFSATSFHREYVRSFDNIVQVMEGIVTSSQVKGQRQNSVRDFFYAEDKGHREHFWRTSSGGLYTFGWEPIPVDGIPSDKILLGVPLKTEKDLFKYYDFFSTGTLRDSTETIYVFRFDQKETIKAALLKGIVYIDSASHAITRMEYEMSPKGYEYQVPNRTTGGIRICKPPAFVEVVRETGVINFRQIGKKWFLANHIVNTQFNASADTSKASQFMKLRIEKIVTDFDTTSRRESADQPLRAASITHNYIKSNFENYSSAKSEWPGDIILKADTSIFESVRTLRMNNQLWERKEGRKALVKLQSSTTFTPDQLRKDLAYLKQTFFQLHPSLKDPVQKNHFARMIANVERHLQRDMTENQFLRHLAPVIESIHCGHTQLRPSIATEEYNRKFGKYFPFDVAVSGRRAFLSENVADSARGSEILEINGTAMASILQIIRYKASTEGVSVSGKDYYLGKHFADLYGNYILQTDSFRITLKDHKTKKVRVGTFAASNFRVQEKSPEEPVRTIDSIQAALINIPEKGTANASTKVFLDKIFPLINRSAITNLIIDLRDNHSFGAEDASLLYAHISSAPFTYIKEIILPTADTSILYRLHINDIPFKQAAPAFAEGIVRTDSSITYSAHAGVGESGMLPSPFNGNVYVLVNGGSSGSAIDFARFVQLQERGIIIGHEGHAAFHGSCDAGATAIALPHSRLRINLPFAEYKLNYSSDIDRRLLPDHLVQYSIDDIIGKKDVELELCRKVIVASCCSAQSN